MATISNKEIFTVKINDKDIEVAVVRPTMGINKDAQLEYNKTFSTLLENGTMLRDKLDEYLKKQGIWSNERETQYKILVEELNDSELKLKKGGIKLTEARETAIKMKEMREEIQKLISKRVEYDTNTVEGQCENARFNYLVSRCAVYNNSGKPIFSDLEDYLDKSREEYASEIASKFAGLIIDLRNKDIFTLPENKFLKQWNFINEDGKLINKEGQLINKDGHLVDKEGRLINSENQLVDKNGVFLDKEGFYNVKSSPFLDDEGKEIQEVQEITINA
jgi:hypothetical protein